MFKIRTVFLVPIGCLVLFAGCDDATVAPLLGEELSAQEMAEIALESDELTDQILDLEFSEAVSKAGNTTQTTNRSFSASRSCPLGGRVSVNAQMQRTFDPVSRVLEAMFSGSRQREDCMFARGEFTITVNSSSSWEAFRRRVEGRFDGPQTAHYEGVMDAVRSDGEQRSCEFLLDIVRDPTAGIRSLSGSICGTTIERSVSWTVAGID